MTYLAFFLILVVLILVHEFGHFAAAKLFGIRVEEFAIGFPPRIARVRKGETEYTFNLLLVGGFVRIFGEKAGEGKGDPRSFSDRSRWIQAAIVVAGIVMNLVFAWAALSAGYMIGLRTEVDAQNRPHVQDIRLAVEDVLPNSPAQKAGVMPGDLIASVKTDGGELSATATPEEAQNFVGAHQNQPLVIAVDRAGKKFTYFATPSAGVITDEPDRKALGIAFVDIGIERLNPIQALWQGGALTWQETHDTAVALWGFAGSILHGSANLGEVTGPVGIAKTGAGAVAQGWNTAIFFMALISINLALINIIPIPGLDGGRLLFIAIEGITRRPLNDRIANAITAVGFSLLILLMIVVTWHDIAALL